MSKKRTPGLEAAPAFAVDLDLGQAATEAAVTGYVPQPHHHWRTPPAPDTKIDWLRRLGRPVARLGTGISLVVFALAHAVAAMTSAITAAPAPDMSGLMSTMAIIAGYFGFDLATYHRERIKGVG